jgi:serine/threonine protein kinase
MAQERIKEHIQSRATDVYSFGVLMWEVITHERPWVYHGGGKGYSTSPKIGFFPPSMRQIAEIGGWCLYPDPARRPTFKHIIRELAQHQQHYAALLANAEVAPV